MSVAPNRVRMSQTGISAPITEAVCTTGRSGSLVIVNGNTPYAW